MTKVLRNEHLHLTLIVNGNQPKKELSDLEHATRALSRENNNLLAEKRKLKKAGQQEKARYKEITSKIEENTAAITANEAKMAKLKQKMGLNALSMKDLRIEAKRLKAAFDKSVPGSKDWLYYKNLLEQVKNRMAQVRHESGAARMSMRKLADGFNRFALLGATVIATLTGISMGIKKLVNSYFDLTDTLADVKKTTGLTDDSVKELYTDLKKIDTRTANEELLGLARIAGKLGVEGKENIEGFVKAADQIVVALGQDLGGDVEETIRQVGKLVDIFKVGDEFGLEDGMLKVGSSINALGAASTANEGFLVEFTKRVGGVATQANHSIEDILGLAATLDRLGQTSEVSATTYNKVMVDMFKDSSKYAKIAGMDTQSFIELLKTDSNEAFIQFVAGLNGNNEGLSEMAAKLNNLGLDGSRSTQVLATLANDIELLREQQKLSNEEFEKGTSLTEEFNIKNNTAAARLDKAKKKMSEAAETLGEKLAPVVVSVAGYFTKMLKALIVLIDFTAKYSHIIVPLIATIGAYVVALKAQIAINKLGVFWNNTLGGSFKGVWLAGKAALTKLWALIKAHPFALVIAAGTALITFWDTLFGSMSEVAEMQKEINKQMGEHLVKTRKFQKAIRDTTDDFEGRKKVIDELKKEYPNLIDSEITYESKQEDLLKAIDKVNEAMRERIKIQVYQQKQNELMSQLADIEMMKFEKGAYIGGIDLNKFKKDAEDEINKKYDELTAMIENAEANLKSLNVKAKLNTETEEEGEIDTETEEEGEGSYNKTQKEKEKDLTDYILGLKKGLIEDKLKLLDLELEDELAKIEESTAAETQKAEARSLVFIKYEKLKQKEKERIAAEEIRLNKEMQDKAIEAMQLAYEKEKLQLDQQYLDGKLTKTQYNEELENLELAHQVAIIEIKRLSGENVVELEQQLLSRKISIMEEEKAAAADKAKAIIDARKSETDAAFQAAVAAVNSAETIVDAGKAVINAIREQIKKHILAIVAKQVAQAIATIPFPLNLVAGAAAAGAVTALFNRLVPQFEKGRYPYKGAQTGKTYLATTGTGETGIYNSPTFIPGFGLVGEEKPEIVIDGKTTHKILNFHPEILDAIQFARGINPRPVKQFAEGKYPKTTVQDNSELIALIQMQTNAINALNRELNKGITAKTDFVQHREVEQEYNSIMNEVSG